MEKNIFKENMRRFKTKNLTEDINTVSADNYGNLIIGDSTYAATYGNKDVHIEKALHVSDKLKLKIRIPYGLGTLIRATMVGEMKKSGTWEDAKEKNPDNPRVKITINGILVLFIPGKNITSTDKLGVVIDLNDSYNDHVKSALTEKPELITFDNVGLKKKKKQLELTKEV